jgi:single-strand DNA-binding protein
MASFNQVILLGNLTRDPQMRFLPSQTPVADFGMACNRRWRDAQGQDREEVMFIDCAAFGKPAELINQYCQKGSLFFVQGRLKLDTCQDKQGGGKRSKHKEVVENFTLMPRRDGAAPAGGAGDEGGARQAPPQRRAMPPQRQAPQQQAAPAQEAQAPYDEQQQFKDDDIPF